MGELVQRLESAEAGSRLHSSDCPICGFVLVECERCRELATIVDQTVQGFRDDYLAALNRRYLVKAVSHDQ
jgi:predicted RNA-binding Zn-ribbon protein involved in translation (DUF1610 family)